MVNNITVEAVEEEFKAQEKVKTTAFDAKNYLNIKLENGQTEKELKIRILPVDANTNSPFKRIYTHTVRVPKEVSPSGWKSYVCLQKTEDVDHEKLGHKCPFCEMQHIAYENSVNATNEVDKQRWKDVSLSNIAKESCIVRCIERGNETDGPKFWKFNVRTDGLDPKHIIGNLMKTRQQENIDEGEEPGNILDIYNGKDLKVTIKASTSEKTKNKTSIEIVDYGKNKPLSTSDEEIDKWVNDTKIWSDVFVAKPYDYLKIILNGDIPFFDKNNKVWVKKEDFNEAKSKMAEDADNDIREAEQAAISNSNQSENDGELPF